MTGKQGQRSGHSKNINEKYAEEVMKAVLFQMLPKCAPALGIALLLSACAAQPVVPETAEDAVAALEANTVASNVSESGEGGEGDEKVVCRSEVVTGTNFKRRTCRTVAEWEARSQIQRRVVDDRADAERSQAGVDSANGAATGNALGR
jgi:hypothetical protein